MNFLAHIFLSGTNDYVKIGNFMADSIKGNSYLDYPKDIQRGIIIHRNIDFYTDKHPLFSKGRKRLFEHYGHYSGIIMDLYYDYLLTKNWSKYSSVSLSDYIEDFYQLLVRYEDQLTVSVRKFYKIMIKHNWLWSYASFEGLQDILNQMQKRINYRGATSFTVDFLKKDLETFNDEFLSFFEDIQQFLARSETTNRINKKLIL